MLKLKRLEMQGFKSFCDRTELRFHGEGIAVIVGPNGCGKSNVSDAISWVLGEQSAKSLRGGSMQDVIFAGTRERKPVGMAQVHLTLIDPDAPDAPPAPPHKEHTANGHTGNGHAGNGHSGNGHTANGHAGNGHETTGNGFPGTTDGHQAPEPHPAHASHAHHRPREITVTRRLFRSGESEYRINGKTARLRDIQDLFLGTGLGPESYAIIEQGRIGQILSSRPYDRRAIIEEAAGITRFKMRRKLAEARLESAKQNLTRVFDILCEVERQMNSLKRQAAKAKRYAELKEEYTTHLRTVLTGRFQTLEREAGKVALDLKSAVRQLENLQVEVSRREQAQEQLRQQLYQTEAALTAARKRLADLNLETERTRGRLANQASQVAHIEQRLSAGETESGQLEERTRQLEHDLGAHTAALEQLDQETAAARARLEAKNAERDQLQHNLRDRERAIEASRQQVLRLLGEANSVRNQLAQISSYLESVDREKARAAREEAAAAAELDTLRGASVEANAKLAAARQTLDQLSGARKQLEADLNERRARTREMRQSLDQVRHEVSTLKARRQSLEEILSHHTYTTQTVKKLFTSIGRGQGPGIKPLGVLADFIDLEPGYEKAVEEFLHEELEYVVVETWDEAAQGIDFVRSDGNGRVTFYVREGPGITGDGPPPEPAGATRLASLMRVSDRLPAGCFDLFPRISRCYLAPDRAAAERLSAAWPDCYFLLPDGVCYHGSSVSGGKKSGSGPLALKRELRDLGQKTAQREQALAEAQARLDETEGQIVRLGEELERLRLQQQTREKEAVALDHECRKIQGEISRAESRQSVARLDLKRLDQEAERSAARQQENEKALKAKEEARTEQERIVEAARRDLESHSASAARLAEEHSAIRVELAGLEERRRAEHAARSRIENQHRELANRKHALAAEMNRLGAERSRLLGSNVDLEELSRKLAAGIEESQNQVTELAAAEEQQRSALAAAEEELKQQRGQVQGAMEHRSETEVHLVRLQSELRFLDETSRKELGVGVRELESAAGELAIDDSQLAEEQEKCDRVRQRIEALGPVNPQALEQYEEVKDRFDFLTVQRQDLLDSIRDTEKAIQDIDVESRKKFQAAFEAINAHFRETFKTLFGGGIAEMRLTDENNLADSGIDIVGSPPGKRLQNILLLSGGEKALTAMALLMAIFKYRPSPFCVLDEVDAPLDEPNIMRFTRLVKEMAEETQFVIITHAKRTMEAAQILYGVTMQEPGVSSVVSVRFDPVRQQPELAMAGAGR